MRRSAELALLAVVLGGCGRDEVLLARSPTPTPATNPSEPDGGSPGTDAAGSDAAAPGPRSVFDPAADLEPPDVQTIFAPSGPRPVMQGSPFRLVFAGGAYLIFWVENRGTGGLVSVVQKVAPTLGPKRDLLPDPPESLDHAMRFRPLARVEEGRVALAWWTRRAAMMAWTDFEGRLVEGPVEVFSFTRPNDHYLRSLHRAPDGGFFFFGTTFEDRDDGLRVTRVDARGGFVERRVVPAVFAREPFDFVDIVPDGEGWRLAWNTRRTPPNDPSAVRTTRLDGDFAVLEERTHLEAKTAVAGALWPEGAPRYMAPRVYREGYRLLALDDAGPRRAVPARLWSQVVPEGGGERVGLLVQTGDKPTSPGLGLPTGLAFRAWDPATDSLSEPTVLQADDGRCLERAEGVAAGDRVGVAWVMGCDQRTLYFAELRAR